MMTKEEREEIQGRLDKIMPGKWAAMPYPDCIRIIVEHDGIWEVVTGFDNTEFVAHAPEDMRKLLGEIARLKLFESLCESMADTNKRVAEKTLELITDRHNYKRRAEALEKAIREDELCVHCYPNELYCDKDGLTCRNREQWQFDESKFSTGGGGE